MPSLGEDVVGVAAAPAAAPAHLLQAFLAVPIIHFPLLRVSQHFIGCGLEWK